MNLLKKLAAVAGSVAIVAGMSSALAAPAQAAPPCRGTWTVGVGGLGNNDSSVFPTVHQRVGYNSADTRGGVNELNRLVRDHRNQCGGDHIKIIGHSGGAAVVHVWVSENGGGFGNVNAILLADPKRAAGPGGPGFAQTDFPFNIYPPLAGSDANFRGVPVLTICNGNDHICNSQSDWIGYATGAHSAYDFDVNHYSNNASGVVFR